MLPLRILFLSPRRCWPPLTGAKLREYHLARALGRRSVLTHVCFSTEAMDLPFCDEIVPIPPPRLYTPGKILRGLFGGLPLPVLNYFSPRMNAAVDALLRRKQFDLIHLDSIHMGAYLPLIRRYAGAPVVFDWHNIESEAMERYALAARSPLRKAYAALTARRLAAFEGHALREGLGHAVCSTREKERLSAFYPSARLAVIENGVDVRSFQYDAGPAAPGRQTVVFVGSMDYLPNVDAVVSFARAAWPGIRERFPHWRFVIVGSNPAPAVRALHGRENIEVTGTVDDVRVYYRNAFAAVVPLRTGGGTRLKILEAMAAGVPVVSTALGAEGLAASPGTNILIAGKDDDWLAHLTALSRPDGPWNTLAAAGLELVRSRYDWEVIGANLYETYCQWLAQTR